MIDDMTSLKQAMIQMDAEDPVAAEAAKARAAQILSNAKQIEERETCTMSDNGADTRSRVFFLSTSSLPGARLARMEAIR